jgi:hypothetical protein
MPRPPRLNIPRGATPAPPPPAAAQSAIGEFKNIEAIFANAGYTVKKPPKIGDIRPALLAIGPEEVLWIGAVGVAPAALAKSVEMLRALFNDTLEDIPIHINAFVVKPSGAEAADIESFESVDALAARMEERKAIKDGEPDNFGAYSEYIDTVCGYFNNP